MRVYQQARFEDMVLQLLRDFEWESQAVDVGQWQSVDVKGDRSKVTWELREAVLAIRMPDSISEVQQLIRPNLPWAEDHLLERVSGYPLNPPPSHKNWPFTQAGHKAFVDAGGLFSHTYPERFWPKHAGDWEARQGCLSAHGDWCDRRGIRFKYGDLADVISRLMNNPLTRQAYLPVWFPEDTGAPAGERVPCSLGYLFMIRNGKLHITYHIRSCDFMRHFRDDVYMAIRLGQWVRDQINLPGVDMGELTMHIGSFHIFQGDRDIVRYLLKQATDKSNTELMRRLG